MGKGGSTTQTTTQEIPSYIRDQINKTFKAVNTTDFNPNIVPKIADMSDATRLGLDNITNLATNNPLQDLAKSKVTDIITGDFSLSDPLQTLLASEAAKATDNVSSLYSSGGRLGSAAFGKSLGEGITNATAPLIADAMEKDQDRKIAAIGEIPGLLDTDFDLANKLLGVGEVEEGYDQALLDRDADVIMAKNKARQDKINNLIAALGGTPTPTKTVESSSPGGLDTFTAIALGLGALSDRRLKVDIKKIGTHSTGLNVYEWEWNAKAFVLGLDKHPRKGFIAQEVQEIFPEAVVEGEHGYLMIDYSKIKEVA